MTKNQITTSILPEEFVSKVESDMNKVAENLPDYMTDVFSNLYEHVPYSESYEFLVGWAFGYCEGNYLQGFSQIYGNTPSNEQVKEIRKIISRRRCQIEQAIRSFLEQMQ